MVDIGQLPFGLLQMRQKLAVGSCRLS